MFTLHKVSNGRWWPEFDCHYQPLHSQSLMPFLPFHSVSQRIKIAAWFKIMTREAELRSEFMDRSVCDGRVLSAKRADLKWEHKTQCNITVGLSHVSFVNVEEKCHAESRRMFHLLHNRIKKGSVLVFVIERILCVQIGCKEAGYEAIPPPDLVYCCSKTRIKCVGKQADWWYRLLLHVIQPLI